MTRREPKRFLAVLSAFVGVSLLALLPACSSCQQGGGGGGAAKDPFSLLPKESNFLVGFNADKVRGTPLWKRLLDVQSQNLEQKKKYEEFVQKTGLDPLKQIDKVTVALPPNASGEFLVLLKGGPFDEAKLSDFLKGQFATDGGELTTTEYNGKKLYSDARSSQTQLVFLDKNLAVLGGKEWIRKAVDLATQGPGKSGESVKQNAALMALVAKARTTDAGWGVGIVPDDVRSKLHDDPRLASASTMKDFYASVDFNTGFTLAGAVNLAGEPEAKELAAKVNEQISEGKRNPQMLMMGLSSYFDAVKADSQGAAFRLDIKMSQQQVDNLIGRLTGLFRSFGAGLGGGSGGGGAPDPSGMPGQMGNGGMGGPGGPGAMPGNP